ncbi:MAG: hypothetical protein JST89_25655 [Cyanobacteria bacterium SZAS-4]|nr:hypothetical protein [Cyanobacteria bacterium SZAS-4]
MQENLEGTKNGVEQQLKNETKTNGIKTVETKNAEAAGEHSIDNVASAKTVTDDTKASADETRTKTLTYKSLISSMILGLIIILVTACAMGGPLNAPQVIKDNFVTNQNSMKNMKGSGGNVTDFLGIRDHWVYFESTDPIVLKDQDKYTPLSPEDLKWKASFFKIYTPEIDALSDIENLSGIEWKKSRYPSADEKYMLMNKRTHEYFFSDRHVESDGF